MSRVIRRVPPGWKHPVDEEGYIPMHDRTVKEAIEKGELQKGEWAAWYRPEWTEEPTHFQVYEEVTEGTPLSPVFESEEELVEWVVDKGYARKAAEKFAEYKYAPSSAIINGQWYNDIAACEFM